VKHLVLIPIKHTTYNKKKLISTHRLKLKPEDHIPNTTKRFIVNSQDHLINVKVCRVNTPKQQEEINLNSQIKAEA
jgi:hypothetical protein